VRAIEDRKPVVTGPIGVRAETAALIREANTSSARKNMQVSRGSQGLEGFDNCIEPDSREYFRRRRGLYQNMIRRSQDYLHGTTQSEVSVKRVVSNRGRQLARSPVFCAGTSKSVDLLSIVL